MGVLGFVSAILLLSFIQWSRKEKTIKHSKLENEEKMETNVLKNILENLNLNYELLEDNECSSVFKMIFQTEKGSLDVIAIMKKHKPYHVAFYTYFPIFIPKKKIKSSRISNFFERRVVYG